MCPLSNTGDFNITGILLLSKCFISSDICLRLLEEWSFNMQLSSPRGSLWLIWCVSTFLSCWHFVKPTYIPNLDWLIDPEVHPRLPVSNKWADVTDTERETQMAELDLSRTGPPVLTQHNMCPRPHEMHTRQWLYSALPTLLKEETES